MFNLLNTDSLQLHWWVSMACSTSSQACYAVGSNCSPTGLRSSSCGSLPFVAAAIAISSTSRDRKCLHCMRCSAKARASAAEVKQQVVGMVPERPLGGTIDWGRCGVVVDLHENAVHPDGHHRPGHRWDQLPQAPAGDAATLQVGKNDSALLQDQHAQQTGAEGMSLTSSGFPAGCCSACVMSAVTGHSASRMSTRLRGSTTRSL